MQPIDAFQSALTAIRAQFPWLDVPDFEQHPSVEALVEIPIQPGLSLPIQLNLQNRDELHLAASNLWVEWFPCTDPEKVKLFVDAVAGLVGGELEIEEAFLFGKPVSATLQRRGRTGEHLARWSNLLSFIPLKKTRRTVCNEGAA
jgi:hypothetical protein